jgi:hypothetical protein
MTVQLDTAVDSAVVTICWNETQQAVKLWTF